MDEEKNNSYMCAVGNPKELRYRSWFYNVFLGHQNIKKNKPKRNEIKVSWLFPSLTKKEIELLQKKTCKVINLSDDIEIEIIDEDDDTLTFKEGFQSLLKIIELLKNNRSLRKGIDEISYYEGNLTDIYEKIKKSKELLKIYEKGD